MTANGPTEEAVERAIQTVKAELESPQFAAALASPAEITYLPGKIVEFQWGYDQTNVDYFIITKRTAKGYVTLQAIGQKDASRPTDPSLTGHCVPDPDNILPKKPILRKVHVSNGKETGIAIRSYGWATLWDGRPSHWTAYA